VSNPSVARLQNLYMDFHSSCFDYNGQFMPSVWNTFAEKHVLCDVSFSEPGFITTMLLIWCTKMLGEFRAILYLVRRLEALPRVPHYTCMVNLRETDEGVIHEIVGLTWKSYVVLHLLITVPKLVINIWLTFMGVRWLAATVSFTDLILNSLGLNFIIQIDEMMLECLFPERMMRSLSMSKFCLPRKKLTDEEDKEDLKKRYHQAIILIVILVSFVFCYLLYFQSVLPNFQWDINPETCKSVRQGAFKPKCGPEALWTHEDCFPYGGNKTLHEA